MEPGSQSVSPSERSTNRAANIIGGIIALFTLIVPLAVIAHYSSESRPLSTSESVRPPARSR
ncbi:MAG: hypothetical protein KME45_21385 [Stenomitos rutilans HA7619-LM2]|nr:hypothetical protein [Stenomitos rutilans HA7619-LM2]